MATWTLLLASILPVAGDIMNAALNKPTSMSSYYGQGALRAGGAVDGNRASRWPNIINTAENRTFSWWKVDLGRNVQDATVRLYFRTEYKYRRNGVKLYTSTETFPKSHPTSQGQLCHTVTGSGYGSDISNMISKKCPGRWRYLMVFTNTSNDRKGAVLDFGEVEVDACDPRTYGANCSKMCSYRHCSSSTSDCNPQTGKCPDGCEPGWAGMDCTRKCPTDTFGSDCTSCTTRHCLGESDCPADGTCSQGCQDGWTGNNCTQECPDGTFGSNCTPCSTRHCQGESDCPADGTCSYGCQDGWTGQACITECTKSKNGRDCSPDCSYCETGCEPLSTQCPASCRPTRNRSECDVSGSSGHVLGDHLLVIVCSAGGSGVVFICIIVWVIYKRRKRRLPRVRRTRQDVEAIAEANGDQTSDAAREQAACLPIYEADIPVHAEHQQEAAVVDAYNHCVYYNIEEPEIIRDIDIANLESTVARIAKQKGFNTLFESLPEGFLAPYEDSRLAVNAGKNKYKEYYPYDHNRVRLSLFPDAPGSDYINASIMHVYDNEKTYIGAQAPNKKTVDDFWRMIWEQRCGRVVMLTRLVEGNIVKSYKYWPDDVFMDTDNFHIELTSTQQRANHTLRYVQLSSYKTGESRRVVQCHYTTWPDHGVPDTLALVNFIWMMRRTHTRTDGPLLVHCSAGVGRTGTYIAVDSLLDQAREEGKVDVQGYVSMMRGQRKNMIQTVDQYECVFNCLVEMTKYGNTSLTVDDFSTLYTNSGMDARVDSGGRTFRELAQMQLAEKRNDSPAQNRLWVDGNQEFLVTALPSLRSVRGHLLCECPHPGQEKLLWKLVEENNVNNVIVVSQEQQIVDLKQGCTIKLGEVTLTCLETRRMESELCFSQLVLKDNRKEHAIKLFRFSGSASIGGVTARVLDHASLRAVAEDVDPAVIVHSQTDMQVAVSLTIVLNVLAGVLSDHRVDITGHIRTSLKCCPQLRLSEHEMEELHNVALRCVHTLEADRTYANI